MTWLLVMCITSGGPAICLDGGLLASENLCMWAGAGIADATVKEVPTVAIWWTCTEQSSV